MTVEEMTGRILERVQERDFVTFIELEKLIGREAKEDMRIEFQPNVVIWDEGSEEFMGAIHLLRERGEIEYFSDPYTSLRYYFDGKRLPFPLARRIPKGGYRRPHWLPITIRPARQKPPGDWERPELQSRSRHPHSQSDTRSPAGHD